jgi:hypothetical protein
VAHRNTEGFKEGILAVGAHEEFIGCLPFLGKGEARLRAAWVGENNQSAHFL